MILSTFLPLVLAALAIIDLAVIRVMLAKGRIGEQVFHYIALASLSLPFIAYVMLAWIVPEVGAVELF